MESKIEWWWEVNVGVVQNPASGDTQAPASQTGPTIKSEESKAKRQSLDVGAYELLHAKVPGYGREVVQILPRPSSQIYMIAITFNFDADVDECNEPCLKYTDACGKTRDLDSPLLLAGRGAVDLLCDCVSCLTFINDCRVSATITILVARNPVHPHGHCDDEHPRPRPGHPVPPGYPQPPVDPNYPPGGSTPYPPQPPYPPQQPPYPPQPPYPTGGEPYPGHEPPTYGPADPQQYQSTPAQPRPGRRQ